jgi:hypothetical protein
LEVKQARSIEGWLVQPDRLWPGEVAA